MPNDNTDALLQRIPVEEGIKITLGQETAIITIHLNISCRHEKLMAVAELVCGFVTHLQSNLAQLGGGEYLKN